MRRRIGTVILAVFLLAALAVPAMAAGQGEPVVEEAYADKCTVQFAEGKEEDGILEVKLTSPMDANYLILVQNVKSDKPLGVTEDGSDALVYINQNNNGIFDGSNQTEHPYVYPAYDKYPSETGEYYLYIVSDRDPAFSEFKLVASFRYNTITVADCAHGKVEADKTAKTGETVSLTVTPDEGYRLASLTVMAGDTRVSVDKNNKFTMPEGNVTVTAVFAPAGTSGGASSGSGSVVTTAPVTLTAEKSDNGTVSVEPVSARPGATVNVTPKADEGYRLDKLTVLDSRGSEIKTAENNGVYSFVVPSGSGSIKITASFTKADESAASAEPAAPTEPAAPAAPGKPSFVDVPDDAWFAPAVNWAVDKGITKGTSDTTFSPNADLSRGQAVTFLWRMLGEPTPTNVNPTVDVFVDDYYFNAVVWAIDRGVTKGTSEVAFSPKDTVTRGQLVTFLYRIAGEPAVGQDNPFSDVDGGAYYSSAVIWAAQTGIVQGYPDGTFKPTNSITRAEMVTMLNKGASLVDNA